VITDKRTIAADDFFQGLFTTALEDGEIITAFEFEAPAKAGYAKFANPASRFAMTGVFVARAADGTVRVAVTGAGSDGVFRHTGMEAALAGNWSPDAVNGQVVDASVMLSDIHGSSEYRANPSRSWPSGPSQPPAEFRPILAPAAGRRRQPPRMAAIGPS
jgi:carbon-monoxide dehydrogenase medium subunit